MSPLRAILIASLVLGGGPVLISWFQWLIAWRWLQCSPAQAALEGPKAHHVTLRINSQFFRWAINVTASSQGITFSNVRPTLAPFKPAFVSWDFLTGVKHGHTHVERLALLAFDLHGNKITFHIPEADTDVIAVANTVLMDRQSRASAPDAGKTGS
jgi:hypothetical protein